MESWNNEATPKMEIGREDTREEMCKEETTGGIKQDTHVIRKGTGKGRRERN